MPTVRFTDNIQRHVILGVSCGGVWSTRDGGRTWDVGGNGMRAEYMPPERQFEPNVQDPHMVAQCRANPDVLWVQHHNGIFKSTDAAASWTEIRVVKPSVFGFPVAVHPRNPDTAWFVPGVKDERRYPVDGRVVVNRTRDGDRLAFGSTTGSLWVSDDQGDSWQTLSSNLPPVYAVRFEK